MPEHPSLKGYSSTLPKKILANKYPCVCSLPQKALILFSKSFFAVHKSYSPLRSSIPRYSEISKLGSTATLRDITLILQ